MIDRAAIRGDMGKKREVEPGAPCRLTIEVAVPIVEPADGHGRQPRSYCTRRVGGLVAEEEQQQHRFVHEGWVAELLGAPVRLCAVLSGRVTVAGRSARSKVAGGLQADHDMGDPGEQRRSRSVVQMLGSFAQDDSSSFILVSRLTPPDFGH